MSFSELIENYQQGPKLLAEAIAGMTDEQLKARPVPGKWSTMEVVSHIADFEPILCDRMFRVISHERPLLLVADENLFHETTHPNERDIAAEMNLIQAMRTKMYGILKKLPTDAATRFGVHSFKGLVSLEAVVQAATNHIPHHLKFISQKRAALGI
ncbi:MAG: DinB family protein [Zavarzinella sp.]